ncbi:MAG: hypothetical protein Q9182_002530 [Xanthomendoza sp. 2 TL-2023]
MALSAALISIALVPQLFAQDGDETQKTIPRHPEPPAAAARTFDILKILLRDLTPKMFQRSRLQPRSPVETPPTAYLPYPPPPNYIWPPGPHTQYPPPSETNAPGGWYGGTGTGGQGNSGAGSAAGGSRTSSAAPPTLRIPSLTAFLPINMLLFLIPSSLLPPHPHNRHPQQHQGEEEAPRENPNRRNHPPLIAREPVETPPTQFLPYPPPPNYQWPPGQNPENQYPKPSEFDPPPGVYGGSSGQGNNPYSNGNTGGNSVSSSRNGAVGAGGGAIGKAHLAWILIVTVFATAIVAAGVAWWWRGRRGVGGAGEKGEKKEGGASSAGAIMERMKFWGKKEGGKKDDAAPPAGGEAAAAGEAGGE